jgi:PAS domain S-box-containing protein
MGYSTVPVHPQQVSVAAFLPLHPGKRQDRVTTSSSQESPVEQYQKLHKAWQDLFNAIGDPALVLTPDLVIIAANPAALTATNLSETDILGKKCFEVFHRPGTTSPPAGCPLETHLRAGKLQTATAEMEASGRAYWVSCTPILDEEGKLDKVIHIATDITRFKKTEYALQKSKSLLNESQRIAGIGSWELSIATNRLAWSDEMYRIFEIDPRRFGATQEAYLHAVHPEDRLQVQHAHADSLANRSPFEVTYRLPMTDGRVKFVRMRGTTSYGREGKPLRSFGTVQDITERVQGEQHLHDSEAKFRALLEAPDAMVIADAATGVIREANHAAELLLQQPASAIIGRHLTDMQPPDRAEQTEHDFPHNTPAEGSWRATSILRADGTALPVEVLVRSVAVDNRPLLLGIFRDVSDRKRAEDALRQTREFMQNVLDAVDTGYVIINPDLRIVSANNAYAKLAGLPLADLVGKHCLESGNGRDGALCEQCGVRSTLESGQPAASVHQHRHLRGKAMDVETRSYPLRDAAGKVVSVIVTVADITDRFRLDEQVRNAQKLESVGILAGGIAHDFNNLLAGILGSVSLARMTVIPGSKTDSLLQTAEEACSHATELSHRLLTFAKGGSPHKKVTTIREVLRDAVMLALSGSNVSLKVSFADNLLPVDVDENQMRQVFNNLAINAKEAMPHGGTLMVSARNMQLADRQRPGLSAGHFVRIDFRDTGSGIPPENIGRIFDPYFTTKALGARKGQGLGLTICHSIVQKHGGSIDAESVQGQGTTFTIHLPIAQKAAPPPAPRPAGARVLRPASRKRVMIMDDDETIRLILPEMLEHLGFEVTAVPDSASAVTAFRTAKETGSPYAIVILDLTIPGGKGGVDTLAELKRLDPEIVAVISTGYADDPIVTNFAENGFTGAIAKPYSMDRLSEMLASVLRTAPHL